MRACYLSCWCEYWMSCTCGCHNRPWRSTVVLWQLHQLPVIEECRQRPSAIITYHGSVQLATVEHRLLQPRLLHQHPQGTCVRILYAGMFWYCQISLMCFYTVAVHGHHRLSGLVHWLAQWRAISGPSTHFHQSTMALNLYSKRSANDRMLVLININWTALTFLFYWICRFCCMIYRY